MNEKDLIEKYFIKRCNDNSIIAGIGDDAAIVTVRPNHQLVITTDTMLEGCHFTEKTPPYAIGYKLMAVNISDIAAMGAEPRWATLNLILTHADEEWLEQFSMGLKDCAQSQNISLIGGDTTRGDCLALSVQLIAEIPSNKSMLRSGAQVNDEIFVTGVIGSAAQALEYLQQHNYSHDNLTESQYSALYMPPSRIKLAQDLREVATSAIDISDGLLHELELICAAGQTGAEIQLDQIPLDTVSDGLEFDVMKAITGGEDYELLFTAATHHAEAIYSLANKHHCKISSIGKITEDKPIELYQGNQPVNYPESSGYDHFKNKK